MKRVKLKKQVFNVTVKVNLKPSVKDIKALTLVRAAADIAELRECRVGNVYNFSFEATDLGAAEKIVEEICSEILANSVIELYEVSWC